MDNRLIQSINQEIYRRFPDLNGCTPRVTAYRPAQPRPPRPRFGARLAMALGISSGAPVGAFLLTYTGRKVTSTGKRLPYTVRVVVSENGKILKTTMSH